MKKVLLFSTILTTMLAYEALAVETGAAGPRTASCPKAFHGFHVGGNIGYGIGLVKWRVNSIAFPRNKADLAAKGVDGGVGVGYTHRFCDWALRLSFDANWADVKGNQFRLTSARLKNSLHLYGGVGYVMREMAMPFIALGWDNAKWKFSGFTNARNKRLDGLMWKAGVDFLATKHVIVGGEYTGTQYDKHKINYNKFALTAKVVF